MKISILTPSYNSVKYIEQAIKSVLSQDYSEWEHIVIDGGSTDGTVEILKKYDHLKWLSEPDKGQSDAMNKAFELSNGELIIYLNVDDTIEPCAFSKVISYFNTHSDCKLLVGDLNVWDNNHILKYKHSPSTKLVDIFDLIKLKFPLNPASYYYKREVQERIGQFPLNNHYSMDYWFLLRAYNYFQIDKIDFVLGNYVHTGENKSFSFVEGKSSLFNDLLDFLCEMKMIAKHKHFLISCHENYLKEVSDYRKKIAERAFSYSNLAYRIKRKFRNMIMHNL